MEKARFRVGRNVRNMRRSRNMSQQQLASLSDIPKSTLNHIESAVSAPSIEAVESLAIALSVSVEELISGGSAKVELRKKSSMPLIRSSRGAAIYRILPDPFSGIDFYFCEISPSSHMSGSMQNSAGKKLVYCINGSVTLHLAGEDYYIEEGGSAIFPGDIAHSFANRGTKKCQFIKIHYYVTTNAKPRNQRQSIPT
jgi:transcriptional regulator with XRE-family HTH domain